MRELSGRQITGIAKLTDRNAAEFNALVAAVDACDGAPVRLDLTDLDISGLWRRQGDAFFELAVRSNLTLILDPVTAEILESYLLVMGGKASYEVREPEVVAEEEDPRIQQFGEEYAKYIVERSGVFNFKVCKIGLDTLSSIGMSAQYVRRAIEITAKQAYEKGLKYRIDFSEILFEGGCDIVLADALVECKKRYKIVIKVIGDEGIAEYVRVSGNVRLPAESKVRFFERLLFAGTVLRLNTYKATNRSDIAGRKDDGVISGTKLVLFRKVEGTDVWFDEISTYSLFLPEDLVAVGEKPHEGDTHVQRCRNIAELGIYGVCTGSLGHFGPVDKNEVYQVSVNGALTEMAEPDFVARGLRALGLDFNEELLAQGRIFTPIKMS